MASHLILPDGTVAGVIPDGVPPPTTMPDGSPIPKGATMRPATQDMGQGPQPGADFISMLPGMSKGDIAGVALGIGLPMVLGGPLASGAASLVSKIPAVSTALGGSIGPMAAGAGRAVVTGAQYLADMLLGGAGYAGGQAFDEKWQPGDIPRDFVVGAGSSLAGRGAGDLLKAGAEGLGPPALALLKKTPVIKQGLDMANAWTSTAAGMKVKTLAQRLGLPPLESWDELGKQSSEAFNELKSMFGAADSPAIPLPTFSELMTRATADKEIERRMAKAVGASVWKDIKATWEASQRGAAAPGVSVIDLNGLTKFDTSTEGFKKSAQSTKDLVAAIRESFRGDVKASGVPGAAEAMESAWGLGAEKYKVAATKEISQAVQRATRPDAGFDLNRFFEQMRGRLPRLKSMMEPEQYDSLLAELKGIGFKLDNTALSKPSLLFRAAKKTAEAGTRGVTMGVEEMSLPKAIEAHRKRGER